MFLVKFEHSAFHHKHFTQTSEKKSILVNCLRYCLKTYQLTSVIRHTKKIESRVDNKFFKCFMFLVIGQMDINLKEVEFFEILDSYSCLLYPPHKHIREV